MSIKFLNDGHDCASTALSHGCIGEGRESDAVNCAV